MAIVGRAGIHHDKADFHSFRQIRQESEKTTGIDLIGKDVDQQATSRKEKQVEKRE